MGKKKTKESKADSEGKDPVRPKAKPRKKAVKPPESVKRLPVVGIDRYFQRRDVPKGHREAMRRYTNTTKATMEQWDSIFKDY